MQEKDVVMIHLSKLYVLHYFSEQHPRERSAGGLTCHYNRTWAIVLKTVAGILETMGIFGPWILQTDQEFLGNLSCFFYLPVFAQFCQPTLNINISYNLLISLWQRYCTSKLFFFLKKSHFNSVHIVCLSQNLEELI